MSLRDQAEDDLALVLEDTEGFGWPITVTDPAGATADLVGASNDIAQAIDPDTGQLVSGRVASVVLRLSSLTAASLAIPEGIADSASKPWTIQFNDINGTAYIFKVVQSNPDRALGVVSLQLEIFEAAP